MTLEMDKVLVVEDNELNLKLFQDLLLTQDLEVIASRDGKGVAEIAEKEMPKLILMDIQLNGLSGIDLIKELKGNTKTKHIPIISVTAFAMKNDEARVTASGCDLYLSKPVSINSFFEAVNKFIKPVKTGAK